MGQRKKKSSRALWSFGGKEPDDKIHQAAKALVNVLKDSKEPMTRDQVLEALGTKDLGTKQPAIRVLYHWKKFLKENGYIVITKQEPKLPEVAVEAAPVEAPVAAPVA